MNERQTLKETELLEDSLNEIEFFDALNKYASKCLGKGGKEIILNARPSDDFDVLREEFDSIEEILRIKTEDDPVPLENYEDVREKLKQSKIENAILSGTDILKITNFLRIARAVYYYFENRRTSRPVLWKEAENITLDKLLEKRVADALDERGEVKDNASKELFAIRREIIRKSAQIRDAMSKIKRKAYEEDLAQEDFVTLREGRFAIPVKSAHKRHIQGIIHGVSQTGATVFIEPAEVIEMNNELALLLNEEKKEVYKILSGLTSEIGRKADLFLANFDIIARLDARLAKAEIALEYSCSKPILTKKRRLELKNARHPLLVFKKGLDSVAPLSLYFDDKLKGRLISGPNAGGKTVALKSVGLNVALALSGFYSFGEIQTDYRRIYSRIGDKQSIELDLSAYSSQIERIKNILEYADYQSLALLDEIASGTDSREGAAIAAGILDSLLEINAFFIATTHNTSLKSYALNKSEIQNDSLEFDEKSLTPTYKYLQGTPGNSYAFQLAQNVGLPKTALSRAKKYLSSDEFSLEESVRQLRLKAAEYERLAAETKKELAKAREAKEKYEAKFKEIKKTKSEILAKAREEAAEIVKNANALIEATIKEIREKEKAPKETLKTFNREKEKIITRAKKNETDNAAAESFQKGDWVALEGVETPGSIIEIYEKGKVLVDFDGLKLATDAKKLKKSDARPKRKRSRSPDSYVSFDAKTSVDVRGKRAWEAIPEIEEALVKANAANMRELTIIHGKGTGRLKSAVREYLSECPYVEDFRGGEITEGGDGVTVAKLREGSYL